MIFPSLLRIERVCHAVFTTRFFYFVRLRRSVRVHTDTGSVRANDYSVDMLRKGKTSDRPLRLIRPLSVIDKVKKQGDVLSVGCRFETELLYLVGYGFDGKKIRGLDMVSYSPWVDTGNMHAMPYPDNSFDTVLLGWVIPYSDSPELAAKEVVRVAREGAVIAIGVSYYPRDLLQKHKDEGTCVGGVENRLQTVESYLKLFAGHVGEVFHTHDAANPEKEGICTVIFSIKK